MSSVITATRVRRALLATVQANIDSALTLIEADPDENVAGTILRPQSWVARDALNLEEITDQLSPVVIATMADLAPDPVLERPMSSRQSGVETCDVHAVIRGTDYENVADQVGWYAGAIQLAVAMDTTLGGVARNTEWQRNGYVPLELSDRRTVGACTVTFAVHVDTTVDPG